MIVSGIFHPDVGGPATYLHELASTLASRGHGVGVVAYGDRSAKATYPFPVWRVPRAGHPAQRLIRFTRELLHVGAGFPLWYVNDYGIPAAAAAVVLRPRIVMKIVGDFAWEYARRHRLTQDGIDPFQKTRYGLRIRLLKAIQRFYVNRADCVVVPSSYLGELVQGWGVPASRIRVINNAAVGPGQTELPVESRPRVDGLVLTAARLTSWKGMDTVLRALARVRARLPHARLTVAGGGPEQARLMRLASALHLDDRVEWLGDIDRAVLLKRMGEARVFVLLSEYEGFSHVLLEALASGLPTVASTAGGNRELIRDDIDGLLVPPGDEARAAAAIEALLDNDDRWQRFSAAGIRRARDFTWSRLMEQTVDLFSSVDATNMGVAGGRWRASSR